MNPTELLSTELVYAKLRDGILRGRFMPGERLTTQRLAEELRLSRTPVREALARLESDGLVSRTENWGYFVRKITLRDAEEIFESRLVIEVAAAEIAANRASENDFGVMQSCLSEARECLKAKDLIGFQIHARRFHEQIVRGTGNGSLFRMFAQLNDLVLLFGLSLLRAKPTRAGEMVEENARIFKAIHARNAVKASELMAEHVSKGHQTFRDVATTIRPEITLN